MMPESGSPTGRHSHAHRRAMLRIANLLFWRSLREDSSEPQTDPLE